MSIAALIIALISLITTIVFSTKNYRKSKRLEFFQRRDRLFSTISDLNAKNTESHLISARYEIVAQKKASLTFEGEYAERIKREIVLIQELRNKIELAAKNWDENIDYLHSICSNLNPKADAAAVEKLIAMNQVVSDELKKVNDSSLASLHILEGIEPLLKADIEELRRLELLQAELNLKAMKDVTEKPVL